MFPEATDVHRFLAVSEAVAHLDLAHSEGKIDVELSEPRRCIRSSQLAADELMRIRDKALVIYHLTFIICHLE